MSFLRKFSRKPPESKQTKHDWDKGEVIGYLPQSEPRWVTEFGYHPPVRKYTCKKCGVTRTGPVNSGFFLHTLLFEEDCPGNRINP